MDKKQTAVEWLVNVVQSCIATDYIPKEIIDKAKAMEQDATIQAYSNGWHDGQDVILSQVKHIDIGGDKAGEQYFNETYKTEDNGE